MHEQSETVEYDGRWYNVYGRKTKRAGQILPEDGGPYISREEAVAAARKRSEQHGEDTLLRMLTDMTSKR